MKLYKLILIFVGISFAWGLSAQSTLGEARIYINPGHGGWGSNDRPMATINYAVLDTAGFFETNTDLLKGLSLRDELTKAGAGYIKISRTRNGIAAIPNPIWNEEAESEGQIVALSAIREDVETNNMDYFLSIHSNAATEGSTTNYPLLLYRGTDAAAGNGLVEAKNMAIDAWKYIAKNGVTYYSAYTAAGSNNNRGDITFMGSSGETINNGVAYTGYYGVLLHGTDGFLSEGCFHTYQPERHRLLNKDYCRQEGVRYSRAIRGWFGDNTEAKGAIMGTVKDISKPLEHALYTYKINSIDAYSPLNNVPVVLQNEAGVEVARYTTDNEYNGVYVFTDLEPGTYKLHYEIEGYWVETEEIVVVANETSFINKRLTDTSKEEPTGEIVVEEVAYYPHPVQDDDVVAASSYNFVKESDLQSVAALADLTIRRAILRDGKYYVLAVDVDKNPKILVLNPVTGELVKEMSTEGIVTEGYNGKKYPYILSDIAFTLDGVLIGTNATVVGKENNGFQTGDFYMYKWQASESVALEEATPQVHLKLATNITANIGAAGNNNSNFMGNSIAIYGNLNSFKFYFDTHAGNAWNTTYGVRYMCWLVEAGAIKATQYNNSGFTESQLGEDVKMTLSPLAIDRFIIDGNKMAPREYQLNWETNDVIEVARFSGDVPVESMGANYFRYAQKVYMSTPVCEKQGELYSYKSHLFDITAGLDKAESIGTTEAVITDQPALTYMASAGVVDNRNIDQYLLVGANMVKYTTKGVEQPGATARVFAYNLASSEKEGGYDVTFDLNAKAETVELIIQDATSGAELKVLQFGALEKGSNQLSVSTEDIPDEATCNWSIRVAGDNVTRFAKLSDDSEAYRFFAPKGIAIDKSPESAYFGRVYVTNTANGDVSGRTTSTGLYVMGADGSDITSQGNAAHSGGVSWSGVNGEGPRKAAIASDGRVFVCDASLANAGIYVMNPATFEASSIFSGATNTAGKLTVGSVYVGGQTMAIGVRGTGAATQLYAVDKSVTGASAWKKYVTTYNIGEANTWTDAPTSATVSSSYVGNDNSTIVPTSTGYWAAQYRGAGSGNSAGTPSMFYYSDSYKEAIYNSAETSLIASSQNGGLAVNEKDGVIAVSSEAGVAILEYKLNKEGIPTVKKVFTNTSFTLGYDDFEFDYAGNLYAVSNAGKIVSVWSMPTDNNSSVTPAKKTMTIKGRNVGIETTQATQATKVYPNPLTDFATVESSDIINSLVVRDMTGVVVHKVANVNETVTTVDFTRFAPGIYFVKVNDGKVVKVVKR